MNSLPFGNILQQSPFKVTLKHALRWWRLFYHHLPKAQGNPVGKGGWTVVTREAIGDQNRVLAETKAAPLPLIALLLFFH